MKIAFAGEEHQMFDIDDLVSAIRETSQSRPKTTVIQKRVLKRVEVKRVCFTCENLPKASFCRTKGISVTPLTPGCSKYKLSEYWKGEEERINKQIN